MSKKYEGLAHDIIEKLGGKRILRKAITVKHVFVLKFSMNRKLISRV